jgi:hypothetical protein
VPYIVPVLVEKEGMKFKYVVEPKSLAKQPVIGMKVPMDWYPLLN